MRKIAVIGAGALARIFCREVQNLLSEDYRVIAVMARNREHAEALADQCAAFACTDINDLLAGFPDLVVEFAGRDAVKAYAQPVLAHGSDLVIASIGVTGNAVHYGILSAYFWPAIMDAKCTSPTARSARLISCKPLPSWARLRSQSATPKRPEVLKERHT